MFRAISIATILIGFLEASWSHKACHLDSKIAEAVKSPQKLSELYEDYKIEHGVEHHSRETPKRLDIFKQFLHRVQGMEADEGVTWKVGITFMAHMTECEKSLYHGDNNQTEAMDNFVKVRSEPPANTLRAGGYFGYLPYTWDWRNQNAVAPVQEQTGPKCWAHTAIVPLEAQLSVSKQKQKSLSSQELIDCVYYGTPEYNDGLGGSKEKAWLWILTEGRLASRADVPDRKKVKDCKWITQARHSNALSGYRITDVRQVEVTDTEEPVMDAVVNYSPVAISMHSKDAGLEEYKGGPYDWRATRCNGAASHAMTIIGYTTKLYIIKNSWGTKWGDGGYLMWVRSTPTAYNCNIFGRATFPILTKKSYYQAERSE